MNEKVVCLANHPGSGNAWQVQLLGSLLFQVLSEYQCLELVQSAERLEASLLAWRARNLLELSVWSTYFARSRENARRLYEEAGRDVKNFLDAFEQWGRNGRLSADSLASIADGKDGLSQRAANEGIGNLESGYMRVEKAAEECGLKDKFKLANKLLSKFAHPTAMQILGSIDEKKQMVQRDTFFGLGCCFFLGAFSALESNVPFVCKGE